MELKPSLLFKSCCNGDDVTHVLEASLSHKHSSFSTWIPDNIKDRCASIFSGKNSSRTRHRANPSEFRYDPLSYALNFEDDDSRLDEYPLRNFSARLPPSPPSKKQSVVVSREIAAWS